MTVLEHIFSGRGTNRLFQLCLWCSLQPIRALLRGCHLSPIGDPGLTIAPMHAIGLGNFRRCTDCFMERRLHGGEELLLSWPMPLSLPAGKGEDGGAEVRLAQEDEGLEGDPEKGSRGSTS
eukprot:CAMPEP_0177621974 /NCGR_PEP_ID=MMETSP0419_2-20121207/27957_1 /TAXON_ID=582737 /ORGANISM="Tetraselmis sp., Strain GSL018" /LENGTH=120 /DNA_ID=CAMNT_0019122099 /DNA_START=860 /DNA_END=1220 /DNA_ORIENTATION=-